MVGKALTRKYQNTDCTGSYTDGYDDSSQDQELSTPQVIAQTTNAKNQRVIHFLDVETNDKGEKENVYGSVTWVNNNTFTTEGLTYTRVSKLAFDNVVVPPTNNQEIEKAVNSVVGYWQSACMANDDPSDTRGKSIQWFAQFEKMSNDTITTTKSVGVFLAMLTVQVLLMSCQILVVKHTTPYQTLNLAMALGILLQPIVMVID